VYQHALTELSRFLPRQPQPNRPLRGEVKTPGRVEDADAHLSQSSDDVSPKGSFDQVDTRPNPVD
jgi:hypothetical protein